MLSLPPNKRQKLCSDDESSLSSTTLNELPSEGAVVHPEFDEITRLLQLDLQKDATEDVVSALEGLDRLVNDDNNDKTQNRTKAMHAGAPVLLVMAMRKWLRQEEVQVWCCSCLIHVLKAKNSARSIVSSGGLEALVTAMRLFPNSSDVQHFACQALMNLDAEEGQATCINDVVRRFVHELEGLQLIQRAMTKFHRSGDLQAYCCSFLFKVASRDEFRQAMVKSGNVAAVATALEHHYDNEQVRTNANSFMKATFGGNAK